VGGQGDGAVRRVDAPAGVPLGPHVLPHVALPGGQLHGRRRLGTTATNDAASDGLPLKAELELSDVLV
jgi:hypothetical protein